MGDGPADRALLCTRVTAGCRMGRRGPPSGGGGAGKGVGDTGVHRPCAGGGVCGGALGLVLVALEEGQVAGAGRGPRACPFGRCRSVALCQGGHHPRPCVPRCRVAGSSRPGGAHKLYLALLTFMAFLLIVSLGGSQGVRARVCMWVVAVTVSHWFPRKQITGV